MATITTITLYPSIGAAWTAALALWVAWVQDNTKVITQGVGSSMGCRSLIMNDTNGGNTYQNILVCADIPGTNVLVPVPHVLQSPGWRTMPPIMQTVYGTTTTITAWDANMLNLRATALGAFCGITAPTWAKTNYTGDVTGYTIRHATTTVRKFTCIGVDAAILGVVDGTVPAGSFISGLSTDGMVQGVLVPGQVTIDPTQWNTLTAALDDLAFQEADYSFNNGHAMFSMRGAFRTG